MSTAVSPAGGTADKVATAAPAGGPEGDAAITRVRPPTDEVAAVRCPAKHPNPPGARRCRRCGADVAEQDEVMIARPALGVLRLADGEVISLERTVIVGRAPDPLAGTTGVRANAIRVDSPGLDVSRNHAEFRADGWQLVVTDLGSANGTTVKQPGGPPILLRRNGSVVVEPGAWVTLADEVVLRYEVTP
ncbi:MAG TPA: FHA domain-containing protein [Pseudonocardiaceae bacterium]